MPEEIQDAIEWALKETIDTPDGSMHVTVEMPDELVGKVREYLNMKSIQYITFSYYDLVQYLY